MAKMLYQGHGSYRFTLDDGTVVYVDPFAGEGYDLPADLILVTHEHFDHNQIDKMPHAAGCEIIRAVDVHPVPDAYLWSRLTACWLQQCRLATRTIRSINALAWCSNWTA